MNKRFYYILIIIVLLTGVCILEQIMIDSYLGNMEIMVYEIIDEVDDKTDVNTTEIYNLVEEAEKTWNHYESNFCFLINYKEIEEIGVEFTKMKVYILENAVTELKASLAQVLYFTDSYRQVMGISLQNII